MRVGGVVVLFLLLGCGARSSLLGEEGSGEGGGAGAATQVETVSSPASSGSQVCSGERCDGVDNDCDGLVDEDDPDVGASCAADQPGVCGEGTWACVAGVLTCDPPIPQAEVCNGLDDDCDGVVDPFPVCLRRVFVTSTVYQGDLGGLAGADAKCQARAAAAGLPGTYRAWLSDSTVSAGARLSRVGAPYVLVDEVTVVAESWEALVLDGFLTNGIAQNELGGPPGNGSLPCGGMIPVWTNTQYDGSIGFAVESCDSWTTTVGAAWLGGAGMANNNWTVSCSLAAPVGCSYTAALYCFEQ